MDGLSKNESSQHRKGHHSAHRNTEQDVQSAHAAWDAWKSNDPEAWDWALEQREKISKKDPKAWNKAMKEVDAEEAAQKRALQAERQRELDATRREHAAADRLRNEYLQKRPTDPSGMRQEEHPALVNPQPDQRQTENLHPGYAPHSQFAPETPNSPAYNTAYNRPRGEFYGVDLGLVKLGVQDGSLTTGVNIGIASTELQLGKNTGVAAEFMPYGGPLHARTNANVGFDEGGMHTEAGAGANFFDLVNGDADFGTRLGPDTSVYGDVRGKVWPVHVQADAGAGVGQHGLNAYTGANTGIGDVFGVRTGGHFDLDENSGAGAGVGLNLGDETLDFGPSVDTYGNRTLRPNLNLRPGKSSKPTFYPTGDRNLD